MAGRRFEAVLEPRGGGNVIELPFDPEDAFGRKRAPVRARANGFEFRTTVAIYGGRAFIGLNREVRERAGVQAGDRVVVELSLDEEPRVVEVPEDLAAVLADAPDAKATFEQLSYTHQREYVRWITEAKRDETRRTRVEKTVAMLREGVKTPD